MVTYGFYNSVDHDRTYDAMQVSELFDGLIREGVYEFIGERFMVRALSGFQVSVGTGRAWYKHTWTKNDATLVLTLPAPPTLPDRYRSDAIVLDINSDIKVRENKITYIKGEESADSNPPHPTLASGTHHQVPLAYIKRVGREEEILQTNINYVVGQSPCPFVVSVIEQIDITDQVAQWNNAWDEWFSNKQGIVETDISNFESVVSSATTEVNNDKAAFKAYVTEQVSEFTIWMSDKKDSFDTWFANLQYILDGDVAGHLQNEIEALQTRVTPIKYGGTGNSHGHIQSGFRSSDTQMGSMATAEGMNTLASGKAAHAEGGGYFSYQQIGEHLAFDDDYYRFFGDIYPNCYTVNPCPTINSSAENEIYVGNQLLLPHYDDGPEPGEQYWNTSRFYDDPATSCYMAIVLTDVTTGEIVKHQIGCIGRNSTNSSSYIGHLNGSEVWGPQNANGIGDIGHFPYQYYDQQNNKYYWYFNRDTVDNSDIVIPNIPTIVMVNQTNGQHKNGIADDWIEFRWYTEPVYLDHMDYTIQEREYILTKGNESGHTYSLQIYYSYSVESEGFVEHPITWEPAGEVLTVSGRPTRAIGDYSHAEGYLTRATGNYSHAEGFGDGDYTDDTRNPGANGLAAHSEGWLTHADGNYSHSEGYATNAVGSASHSGGSFTNAIGNRSLAFGYNVTAFDDDQVVFGNDFNIEGSSTPTEIKRVRTSIFGLPIGNRYIINSESYMPNENRTVEDIVNKNRNGFSIFMKCPETENAISYTTILPNDTFGTFLVSVEIVEGEPSYNLANQDYLIGTVKLTPMGTNGISDPQCLIASITGNSNLFGTILKFDNYLSNGVTYPKVVVSNFSERAVSTSSINKFIRCTLMRLI